MCSAAGSVSNGAICSHLLSSETNVLSFDQYLTFLEAQENPKRGAAVCMSSEDWGAMKTELEVACRMLGNRCSYALKKGILKK